MDPIIWPGQTAHGLNFSPGGISLSREQAVIPVKRSGGNGKIEFLPVHVPSSWGMQMLRTIEQKAFETSTSSSDYFINAPFTLKNGEVVITQEIINTFANEITIEAACAARIGNETLPFLEGGQLIHKSEQVITITTFGKVVMHIGLDGAIMLAFDIQMDVEEKYKDITVLELVSIARETVRSDHFRIGGVIVFPKARKGSVMVPDVLTLIESQFKPVKTIAW